MPKSLSLFSPVALVCALSLAGGSAIAADAGASTTPSAKSAQSVAESSSSAQQAPRARHHRGARAHHRYSKSHDIAMWVPGYGPVSQKAVDALSLNDEQRELVKQAQEAQRSHWDSFKEARGNMEKPAAKSASIDPHAAVKARNERFQRMQQVRSEQTQQWLAVWDALDEKQQASLSTYISQRHEQRRHAHKAKHHRHTKGKEVRKE